MAQNLKLDPVKRDYVLKNGSPIPSDSVLEASYYALKIPENNWLYGAPRQGSYLYLLEGAKRLPSTEQNFAAYATAAIKSQLIDTGLATDMRVRNLAVSRTGSSNNIDVVPNATQVSNQLNFIGV